MLPRLISLFVVLAIPANILGYSSALNDSERLLLESELTLAKKPGLYFILDLKDKRISLKARGILLREWEVKQVRYWGNPVAVKPISLTDKMTILPPKRERIEPGESDEDKKYELKALELDDMPSSYTLSFAGGIFLRIRPEAKGWTSIFPMTLSTLKRHTLFPLKTVWFSVKKKPFTSIEIVLNNKRESQALYWAFTEGTECIIF
ncbi:MAG: hypothetical protein OEY25_11800 [Candidatus Aminicenantes bacterium]|nr:hypothetical protein [Candidatus Aminicenantes bacterium]